MTNVANPRQTRLVATFPTRLTLVSQLNWYALEFNKHGWGESKDKKVQCTTGHTFPETFYPNGLFISMTE